MISVSYRWTDVLGDVQDGIIYNETITAASHPYILRYVDIGDVYLPPMRPLRVTEDSGQLRQFSWCNSGYSTVTDPLSPEYDPRSLR